MTDEERAKSILEELEYNYIGYGSMHEDDEQGFRVIEAALKKTVPLKPETQFENGCNNAFCPSCKGYVGIIGTSKGGRQYCVWCGQRIDWEGV